MADNNGRNYGQTAQWVRWGLVAKSEIPVRKLQAPSAPQREKGPRQTGLGKFDIKSIDRIRLRTGCIVIASSVWSYLHFFVSPPLHFFSLPYSVPTSVYTTVHRAEFFSLSFHYIRCCLVLTVTVFLDRYICCVVISQSICLSDQEGCVTW